MGTPAREEKNYIEAWVRSSKGTRINTAVSVPYPFNSRVNKV